MYLKTILVLLWFFNVCYDLKIYCLTTATNFSGLFLLFFIFLGGEHESIIIIIIFFWNISSNKGFFFNKFF